MNPDIYYYNPTCELAVANGSENFMPNRLLRRMEYDLDFLPALFSRAEDITLVRSLPSSEFLDSLHRTGIGFSKTRLIDSSLNDPAFLDNQKDFLCPWGWSPSVHKLLSPLKPSCSPRYLNSPVAQWSPVHKELYSRKKGVEILRYAVGNSNSACFPQENELPRICYTHDEIIALQKAWGRIVVKSPWSSSGRGLQVLRAGEYNQSNLQVISGYFNQQGYVIAAPWYNKIMDISFQFYSRGNGEIDYLGLCSFLTDKAGRYLGSNIEEIPVDLDPESKDFIKEHISEVQKIIRTALTESDFSTRYQGWIGVDALLYKTENNHLKIQPIIEVNCRYTMGSISLALRKQLAPESKGLIRVVYSRDKNIQDFYKGSKAANPLSANNGKIIKGFLPLAPFTEDSQFGACAIIN